MVAKSIAQITGRTNRVDSVPACSIVSGVFYRLDVPGCRREPAGDLHRLSCPSGGVRTRVDAGSQYAELPEPCSGRNNDMKVGIFEHLVRAGATRRDLLKGAASVAALAAASTGTLGALTRQASAQDNLRAEILKIPGVGKGSPTDADWQKVGELCLGATKANVNGRRVRRRRTDLHGPQQPEPAQLPVPRLPQAVGGLYRRQDQLDRSRPGRLQPRPAADDRDRHGRLRHHRDGRAVRGRHGQQGPARRDARLGANADRDGGLRRLSQASGRHLGRQDLPHHHRRRLPHLRLSQGLFRRRLDLRHGRGARHLGRCQCGAGRPSQERPIR